MTTWNEFVKEIAQKYNLSRKDAMKKASPLWKKKKRGKQTVKDVPEISEFPKVKARKTKKKKDKLNKLPRAKRTKTVRASEFGGRIDIAAPEPKKGYSRMRKKHMILKANPFGFLNR